MTGSQRTNPMMITIAAASKALSVGMPYGFMLNFIAQAVDPTMPTVASVGMGAAGGVGVSVITYFIFKTRTEERLREHREKIDKLEAMAERLDRGVDEIKISLAGLVKESEFRARGMVKSRESDQRETSL